MSMSGTEKEKKKKHDSNKQNTYTHLIPVL